MNPRARVHELLAGRFAAGELHLTGDALRVAAADAFSEGPPPLAVLVPRSAATLADALPRLAEAGVALVPRGAALSYSSGLAPATGDWVALDLRHLAGVLDIDEHDATVRVEAGCTWANLDAALAARGLRTPFRGPASGLHATIGGTLSQDAIFHGSARHGTAADSVLGLVVMLADGRLLRTGTQLPGTTVAAVPCGPDLTRLFLGACGAFGVLLEATLRVLPRPAAVEVAGYRCPTRAIALAALRAAARHGDATDALLVDPSVATRLARLTADDGGPPGRACARDAPWLLGIVTDGASAAEAQARAERIERACLAVGAARDGAGLLAPWQAEPFPPPRMLRATDGRRWVPVHGMVPHSRAATALDALDATMRLAADEVASLDLRWSIACTAVGPGAVLVEANLTWPGDRNPVVEQYLGESAAATTDDTGTAVIGRLRGRLVDALDTIGATHLQLGRLYPYRSRIDPVAGVVLDGLKQLLDPRCALNPGVLGLDPQPRGDRR